VSDKGYFQGYYIVEHREKYISNGVEQNPTYRSSYERKLMYWLDNNVNVIKWNSEGVKIPYYFQMDGKLHFYFVDFYAEILDREGKINKYLIEIKPAKQCELPQPPKRNNIKSYKNYRYKMINYQRNQDKWKAAESFCKKYGMIWKIMSERDLGLI